MTNPRSKLNGGPPRRPTAADVQATFRWHHASSARQQAETSNRELRGEKSTAVSYSGRTVFELVQNALDRSQRLVMVGLFSGSPPLLIVGNDGPGVGVDANFDYDAKDFSRDRHRSDFHALCSLHTSNKAADESIGNKGVGFRSVFALGKYVQIWSRLADVDDAWWGLELHKDFTGAVAKQRAQVDAAVRRGSDWLGETELPPPDDVNPRPSFYFPLPLYSDQAPIPLAEVERLATLVLVPLASDAAYQEAVDKLTELRKTHLYFVGLRPKKSDVHVSVHSADGSVQKIPVGWNSGATDVSGFGAWAPAAAAAGRHPLAKQAESAQHAVTRPGVAVAWPSSRRVESETRPPSLLYCYLPTRIDSPIACDIHADFQLEANRASLNMSEKDAVGRYNAALLEAAAELHVIMVFRQAGFSNSEIRTHMGRRLRHISDPDECVLQESWVPRPELFTLLCPRIDPGHRHPFITHLENIVFGEESSWDSMDCYTCWALLAARHFGQESGPGVNRVAYDAFWEASAAWLMRAGETRRTSFGHRSKFIENSAAALGAALRQSRARVVPLLDGATIANLELVPQSCPLPDRRAPGDGAGRLERRLFLRSAEEAQSGKLHLPAAVLARGRAVTAYPFDDMLPASAERALGATKFGRWELLVDLRQLPARAKKWQLGETITPEAQLELLRFVAELFVTQFRSSEPPQKSAQEYAWGWRTAGDTLQERAGRAMATLFLRTTTGEFEPARQLSPSRLDRGWLRPLAAQVEKLDLDAFLSFLGLSPVDDLLLIEDGEEGLVPPCQSPPILVDAEGGSGAVELVVKKNLATLQTHLEAAWPHLQRLVEAEEKDSLQIKVVEKLSSLAFVSCQTPGFKLPEGLTQQPEFVAARDVVLLPRTDRRSAVVFSLDSSREGLCRLLIALGAIDGLTDQALAKGQAQAARNLFGQLRGRDLHAMAADARARQALVELFQNVLDAIARHAPAEFKPELLAYAPAAEELSLAERSLKWVEQNQSAFIANDSQDREWIRRFFPTIPLSSAVLGKEVVGRLPALGVRSAIVSSTVRSTPLAGGREADQVRAKIERLLPGLLALAEVSRQIPGGLKVEEVFERWRQKKIQRVENVWYELELSAGGATHRACWLKDSLGDVIATGDGILYDMPRDGAEHPPLRAFATVLADAVVGNQVVAGTFALALAEYEAALATGDETRAIERFREHMRKQGAQRLAETYARQMQPLSAEQLGGLRTAVAAALQQCGLELAPPDDETVELPMTLGVEHLRRPNSGFGELGEDDVVKRLMESSVPAELRPFIPSFSCRLRHKEIWRSWIGQGRRHEQLLALAKRLLEPAGEERATGSDENETALRRVRGGRLEDKVQKLIPRLEFSPQHAAYAWLLDEVNELVSPINLFPLTELDEQLSRSLPKYQDVHCLLPSEQCSWQTRSIGLPPAADRELTPQTPEQRRDEDVIKGGIGADAEQALLTWIAHTTRELLREYGEESWAELHKAARTGSKLERLLRAASEAGPDAHDVLEKALHVSVVNGAAGFDLIGLERDDEGKPKLVCYECKALPSRARAQVHISRNEINVFRRRARSSEGGQWKLVGVHADGTAQELTHHLRPLLDEKSGPLAELAKQGLGFDTITLTIARDAPAVSPPPESPSEE